MLEFKLSLIATAIFFSGISTPGRYKYRFHRFKNVLPISNSQHFYGGYKASQYYF